MKIDKEQNDEFLQRDILLKRYPNGFDGTLYELKKDNADINWRLMEFYAASKGIALSVCLKEEGILFDDKTKLDNILFILKERKTTQKTIFSSYGDFIAGNSDVIPSRIKREALAKKYYNMSFRDLLISEDIFL